MWQVVREHPGRAHAKAASTSRRLCRRIPAGRAGVPRHDDRHDGHGGRLSFSTLDGRNRGAVLTRRPNGLTFRLGFDRDHHDLEVDRSGHGVAAVVVETFEVTDCSTGRTVRRQVRRRLPRTAQALAQLGTAITDWVRRGRVEAPKSPAARRPLRCPTAWSTGTAE